MELAIPDIGSGANMSDVTNIVAFLSQEKAPDRTLFVRNIYFSQ